jgi:hypothetical protein
MLELPVPYFGDINLAFPWLVSGGSTAVAFLILLTFPETGSTDGDDDSFDLTAAFKAIQSHLVGSALIPFVLYAGVFYAVIAGLNYLVQPVARASGISVAQIGLLYADFRALSAGVNTFSGRIEERI